MQVSMLAQKTATSLSAMLIGIDHFILVNPSDVFDLRGREVMVDESFPFHLWGEAYLGSKIKEEKITRAYHQEGLSTA